MHITIELRSIEELAAFFAIVRGEELDADRLSRVASVMEASETRLEAARVAATPPQTP